MSVPARRVVVARQEATYRRPFTGVRRTAQERVGRQRRHAENRLLTEAMPPTVGRDGAFLNIKTDGRRKIKAVTLSVRQSGLVRDPSRVFSQMVKNALQRPATPPCIIYDAQGRPIAVLDPVTRRRRPWTPADGA